MKNFIGIFTSGLNRLLLVGFLLSPLVGPALHGAIPLYWSGGTGTWNTVTAPWSLTAAGTAPFQVWNNGNFDNAVFGLAAGTVTLGTPVSAGSLTFTTTGYTLQGSTLTLGPVGSIDTGSGTQTISSVLAGAATSLTKSGSGSLVLTGANTFTGPTIVGAGSLVVRGIGASIGVASASASTMSVGSSANASLTIDTAGSVKNTSATLGGASGTKGSVVVDGANSLWNITNTSGTTLSIVSGGSGALTLSHGGAMTLVRPATLAPIAGQTADFLVQDAGSTFTGTSLTVGGAGTSTVTIKDGGKVSTTAATFGGAGTTTVMISGGGTMTSSSGISLGNTVAGGARTTNVTVTGVGSKWTGASSVFMDGVTTNLTVADGAVFTGGGLFEIGDLVESVSTVTVGGNSATLNSGTSALVVGNQGSGTLNLNAGGIVNAGFTLRLGGSGANHGVVNQTGGTLNVSEYMDFNSGTPEYHQTGGTLVVGDSGSGVAGITVQAASYTFDLGGGTIQAKGASLTSNAKATLRSGTVTTLSTPDAVTQNMFWEGVLSGTGGLLKTGPGALYLDGANTFSGGLTIQGGKVNPLAAGSLGSGRLTFSGDSILQVDFQNISVANGVTINPAVTGTMDVAVGKTLTLSGAITGAGALAKTSGGTLALSGTNDYSGATTISGGTVLFTKTASLYNSAVASWTDANLTVASGATAAFGVGGAGGFTAGNIDLLKGLGTATSGFKAGSTLGFDTTNAGGNFAYAGSIGDTNSGANALGLVKLGTGSLTLAGANTYTGPTTITAGTLIAGHNSALSTGTIVLNGGTLQSDVARTFANNLSLAATSTVGGASNLVFTGALTNTLAGNLTLNVSNTGTTGFGNVALSSSGSRIVTFNVTGGAVAVGGTVANGAGTSGLTKTGAGTLTLSGNNTYTGATAVSAGTLRATTNATALGGGALTVSGTGALQLANDTGLNFGRNTTVSASTTFTSDVLTNGGAGVTHTLGTLSLGAQTLTLNKGGNVGSGTAGLTFGNVTLSASGAIFAPAAGTLLSLGAVSGNARSFTVNGAGNALISGAISTTTGGVTKSGLGTLTLAGINTYTGATSVTGGTLLVNGSLANTALTIANGATLGGSGSIGGLTTIQSGAHVAPGNSPGTLTFTNGLILNSGSIFDVQLGTVSDLFRVSGGTLTGPAGLGGITLNLSDAGGFNSVLGGTFTLFNFSGATLNNFDISDFTFGTLLAGTDLSDYSFAFAGSTLSLLVSANPSSVPDSGPSVVLFAAVMLGLAGWRRRK